MKQLYKRGVSFLLVVILLVSLLPALPFQASAASYTYNWGTRGKVATELSDAAIDWYNKYNVSYDSLSSYSGSSSVSSVPSSSLYSKLKTLMANAHSDINSYDDIKSLAKYTDCQNGGGSISSFYSGKSVGPSWDGTWNREHTWPNSKGLGGSDENDIMMIRPTSYSENSSRGNTAYGESDSYYDPNDESGGTYNLHGDVARIVLYVYVRWGNTSKMWGSSGVMESKDVLLKWMEEDPVDTWELGRNDAVQSITGTRNVFVDYPELAFDLFAADIPSGYQSPSGSSPSYTITAVPNHTSYGTVSMSGKTITAYPYEGYQVSGYKVTSGSATVTQSGNTFTVSASGDCTIQIIFTARTQVTFNFVDRGVTVSSQTAYGGDVITLPAYTGTAPNGFAFRGWVTQQIANTETKPAVYAENSSFTVVNGITFYALYAKIAEGTTGETAYVLVTSADQLSEGASVVIAASGTTALAMKQTGGTNNRYSGTITKNSDNTISFADDVLIDVLTLGTGVNSGTYSFYSEANGQYLAAGTSSGSNILKLQGSVDAAASFVITVNSDGTATAISQTSSDRNSIRYNSSANVFACYASGQKAISLYVASGGGDEYYTTNPTTCEHADTIETAEVAATCTETGLTAGVYCNDCDTYIHGHEVIAALGHSFGAWVITTAPSCTVAGVETQTCSACGATQTQSVAATGHTMDDGTVTTAATCTAAGVLTYACVDCGATTTESISPIGHNYVHEDGVYTCTNCGDSYDTYYVSFSVPSGVTAVDPIEYVEGGIILPSAGIPSGDYTYTFVGWSTVPVEDTEGMPELLKSGDRFTATAATRLYAVYTYSVSGGGSSEYVLTDISNIQPTDVVVITMTTSSGTVYAMNHTNGTGAAPNGIVITVSGNVLAEEPVDALKWNISSESGSYIIYPNGDNSVSLYCTDKNNGVRVGSNSGNVFTIDASSGYLKNTATGRYVGVYTEKPDWRCYTSTTVNIDNQVLGFYVKGEGSTIYYTSVDSGECVHTNTVTTTVDATCTDSGSVTVVCNDCGEIVTSEVIEALGHSLTEQVIAPSCTEEGYTRYYCSVCGEEDEVSDYVEALGHSYESVVTAPQIGVQGYTTHTCTACGHSYVDSYTDPLPEEVVLPSGNAALKISGATLTLQADLKVAFAVKPEVLEAYSNVYFKFKFAGKEVIISDSYYNTANGRQMYTLPGVAPRMMNDVIEIEMYGTYEGVEYAYTNTYTVMTYCNSQLGKVTEATKLTTLIVDLMNFGTMQQIYNNYKTDALINAGLTEEQKAWGRNVNGDQTFTSVFGQSGVTGTASFTGASLTLSDAVVVRYVVKTDDLTGITLKITVDGEETIIGSEAFVLVEGYTNRYEVKFTGLRARQMRSTITAVVLRDGVETSKTATYSVESYAAGVTSGTNLYNLCQAMMHYGDAAIAYFNS